MKVIILVLLSCVFAKDIKSRIEEKPKKDPTVSWPAHGFNVTFGKETGYVNLFLNMLVDRDKNWAKVTAVADFLGKEREMFQAIIHPGDWNVSLKIKD